MKTQALQYYMHDGPSAFRFELAGELNNEGAGRLEQDRRTASSVMGARTLIVDMTFVTCVGDAGRLLIKQWYAAGARLIAASKASRALVEAIIGEPLPEVLPANSERTWLPFHTFFNGVSAKRTAESRIPWSLTSAFPALQKISSLPIAFALILMLPFPIAGANLKPETVAAWEEYLQSNNVQLEGGFLRIWSDPEALAKVRGGEILVAPVSIQNPQKIHGGLIHHWRGDVFVRDAELEDVLGILRDYDRYQEFYSPTVVESQTRARRPLSPQVVDDQFSMVLMNRAFLVKTAFDADYQATNVRVGNNRFYTVSKTTRLQEVQNFGERGERRVAEGEGGGYVWKLLSITRVEQRDGGVYVEVETIALSREIPAAMHFIVDPIVRRAARDTMSTSLKQTAETVRLFTARVEPNGEHRNLRAAAPAIVKGNAFVKTR